MKDIVLEQNTYIVRATFSDDDGTEVTPTSMSYRVDDMTGGVATSVVANTSVSPVTSYYDIVIPASSNVILDQSHDYEDRVVTVSFLYGATSRRGSGEHEYLLKNMRRIETLMTP